LISTPSVFWLLTVSGRRAHKAKELSGGFQHLLIGAAALNRNPQALKAHFRH
jgi:hypothetical protein